MNTSINCYLKNIIIIPVIYLHSYEFYLFLTQSEKISFYWGTIIS